MSKFLEGGGGDCPPQPPSVYGPVNMATGSNNHARTVEHT